MPTKKRRVRNIEIDKVLAGHLSHEDFFEPNDDLSNKKILGLYASGYICFDENGEPYLHPKHGSITGNNIPNSIKAKREARDTNLQAIKNVCIDIWGKDGKTHIIQKRAKDKGINISIKTLRRYQKLSP